MIDYFTLLLFQWFNVYAGVVISIIPTVSTFVFFLQGFSQDDILNCLQSTDDDRQQ